MSSKSWASVYVGVFLNVYDDWSQEFTYLLMTFSSVAHLLTGKDVKHEKLNY